jgi:CRISPR/Cas system-associated exonuclease Cas4 (RecB family)
MITALLSQPNGEAKVPTSRNYLSYSSLTLYQNCPLRWHFKYVAGLPEATVSSSLVFGGAIHRCFEHYMNELMAGAEPPSLDALMGEYEAVWQGHDMDKVRFGKDEQREGLTGLAQRMLAAFQTSSLARPEGTILGVEEELRGQVVPGCPDILGRLDLVIETEDALIVTDLKTSRSRWSRDQVEDSAGQLLLYHELARNLAPRKRVRLQFAVLTKAKQPTLDLLEVPVNRQRIDRTKRIVERVWRAIEMGSFYPTPSPMQCPTCPFRAPCRAWQG